MAQFDSNEDPAVGGATLTPSPELDAAQEQQPMLPPTPISVPDVSPIIAAMPGHTPLPPQTPLPSAANDPRQRLIQMFTAGLAAGLGPHSGVGAGLGAHLQQQDEEARSDALRQWQVNENERQRQIQAITQQNAELDRQRSNNLQKSLEAFAQGASKAETKEDYDKLADAYGNGLSASGYRISPNWLRANIPWQAPNRLDKIKKAIAKWKANPNNQRLLEQQPEIASNALLNIDEGMPVKLGQALETIGEGLAKGPNGELLVAPKPLAGTTAFDVKLNALMDQWRVENPGKILDPKTRSTLIDQAVASSKEPSALDETEKKLRIEKLRQDIDLAKTPPNQSTMFELTPDKPSAENGNVSDPRTGITPNAVYQNAIAYGLEGKLPTLGMGSRQQVINARNAVQNKAGAIAQASGVTLSQVRAEYAANRSALAKILPQNVATEAAANTASDNLDLAAQASGQVPRTGSRLANRYLLWTQGNLTPATGLTKFEVYVYTAAREYAKVTSGGALSTAGLTDSAAKEAEKLLSVSQSPEAFAAAVDAMKQDMQNVLTERQKSLARVSSTIASFLNGAPVSADTIAPQQPQTPQAPVPGEQKIGRFGVTVKGGQ